MRRSTSIPLWCLAVGATGFLLFFGAPLVLAVLPALFVVAWTVLEEPILGVSAVALISPLGVLVTSHGIAGLNPQHALALLVILAAVVQASMWRGRIDPASMAVLCYALSVLVSFAHALIQGASLAATSSIAIAAVGQPLLAVVVSRLCREEIHVRTVLRALVAGGVLGGLINVLLFVRLIDSSMLGIEAFDIRKDRFVGLSTNPNALSTYYVLLLPIATGMALTEKGAWRGTAVAAAFLGGVVLLASASRSATIGAAFGLAILFFLLVQRQSALARIGSIALLVGLAVGGPWLVAGESASRFQLEERMAEGFNAESLAGRDEIAAVSLQMIMENPLGVGYGQFERRVLEYGQTELSSPHNSLLAIGVAQGWLGLLSAILLVVLAIIYARRALRHSSDQRRIAAGALLGALTGFFVHALVHAVHHFGALWIVLGVAIAWWQVVARTSDPKVSVSKFE